MSASIYFRRKVSCGSEVAYTGSVYFSVTSAPSAPGVYADSYFLCNGVSTTLHAATGGTINWYNSAGTNIGSGTSVVVSTADNYYATASNGCGSSPNSATLGIATASTPVAPVVSGSGGLLCDGASTVLTASGTGTISWYYNGSYYSGSSSIYINTAGVYYATANNGCGNSGASNSVTISTSTTPGAPTVSAGSTFLCNGNSTTLSASGAGTIYWYYNGSYYGSGANITASSAGNYYAIASNSCGNSGASATISISTSSTPSAPVISAGSTLLCNGASTTLSASGSGTIYWYYNGAYYGSGASISVSGEGNYYATASNSCGTSAGSNTVSIATANTPAAPSISATNTFLCNGASATLNASGNGTIYWYYNGSYIGSGTSISVNNAGSYTATASNSCGTSTSSNAVYITTSSTPAVPSIGAGSTYLCNGTATTLSASGSGTINWYYNGAYYGSGSAITASGAGYYYATASNSCGTSATSSSITITTSTSPDAPSISAGSTLLCNGAGTTLSATGSGTINWYQNGTYYGSGASITVSAAADYYATQTNSCGTSTYSNVISIATSSTPAAPSISAGSTFLCNGASTTLSATGSGTISWYQNGAYYGSGSSITVSAAGNYYAIAGNSCGNSAGSNSITITTSNTAAVPTINAGATLLCDGASTTLTASGGNTINWYYNNSYYGSGSSISVSGAGNYYATATNSCGTSTASNTISITTSATPSAPVIQASGSTQICGSVTSVTINVITGSGILWSTGAGGNSIVVTSAGSYTATASNSCGVSPASTPVVVTTGSAPTVAPITVETGSISALCIGSTVILNDLTAGGVWSTSDASIASMSGSTVTGVNAGTATIYYTVTNSCGSTSVSVQVNVVTVPSVAAISGDQSVCSGASFTVSDPTPGGTWSSANSSIASVSASGLVTGQAVGTTDILYSVTNSCGTTTVSHTVTVTTIPALNSITPAFSLCIQGSQNITAGPATGGSWSSSNTAVATVNGSGLVTAVAVGSANLVYTATNGCGSSSISTVVTVGTVPSVDAISVVSGNKDLLCTGADLVLSNTTAGGVWSSDNAAIASVVSGSTVRGVSGGTANIVYTVSNSCGATSVSIPVTVLGPPDVAPIVGNSTVCAGTSTLLTSTTAGGSWSTLNSSIATVDAFGSVTGVSAGTATIQYTVANACTNTVRSFDISVVAKPVIAPISGSNSTCFPEQLILSNTTPGGVWSSYDTNIATVDNNGNLTPLLAGTVVIAYSVTDAAGCSDQVTKSITVYTKPSIPTIIGPTEVCVDNKVVLSSATTGGTWSSSNPAVATISTLGSVTGISAGSTQINYSVTSAGGCTSFTSVVLTVNGLPAVAPITGSSSVCVNGATTLGNTTAGGTWSSSNTAVAEVGQTGIVNGILSGNTQISYSIVQPTGCMSSVQFTFTVSDKVAVPTITGTDMMIKGGSFGFSTDTPGGVWGSSDTLVARVDPSGMVYGLLGGVAQIWYTAGTACGVQLASKSVVVGAPGLTGASNLPGTTVTGTLLQDQAPAAYTANPKLNFVRTRMAIAPVADSAAFRVAGQSEALESTEFMDGIGRTIQTVMKQASPSGKDIIAPVTYDAYGRESVKYLPYASTGSSGWFRSDPYSEQSAFMGNQYPGEQVFYQKSVYEESPLNRISKTMSAGNSWAGTGRGVGQAYLLNSSRDSVRIWEISNDTLTYLNQDSLTNIPKSDKGVYPASELFKQVTVDEQGNAVQEFKDKDGKMLLKRVQADSNASSGHAGWLNTYYVYDDLGMLRFVMPPKAVDQMASSQDWDPGSAANQAMVGELCFRYQYDQRKRMIAKKVPGSGWVYMVYDERDRLVFTQDANQRSYDQWMITIYDSLNRPVSTGIIADSRNRGGIQAMVDAVVAYPAHTPLTYTYFDEYTFTGKSYQNTENALLDDGGNTYADSLPSSASLLTRGFQTGMKLRVLGHPDSLATGNWIETVNFYDEKARLLQTQSDNHKNGLDVSTQRYDFSGKLITSHHVQNNPGANQHISIKTNLLYDGMGRLLSVKKKLNNNDSTTRYLSRNSYNELGQLITKQLGQKSFTDATEMELQQYAYSIRGWLKGINAQATGAIPGGGGSGSGPWFGMRLLYDSGYQQSQFNGNIAGIQWRSRGDGEQRSYGYGYDRSNRLLFADFTQYTDNSWNTSAGLNFTSIMGNGVTHTGAYDANGNILSMKQYGVKINSSSVIDELQYHYRGNSNQLQNVIDAQNDPQTKLGDFRSSSAYLTSLGSKTSAAVDYSYDANGNMTRDLNKDIGTSTNQGIIYNYLNLPYQVGVSVKGTIQYVYDAAGNKLFKKTVQTDSVTRTTVTDYVSGIVYQNDSLLFIGQEEGRIRRKPDGSFVYDYFVKDHLGNTRMVLSEEEQMDAYPAATMEPAQSSVETAYYSNVEETRTAKPAGYPLDNYTDPNNYVSKLNGNGNKVGPGIVLKVMSGDKVNIRASSWYYLNGADPGTPVNPLNDLLNVLATGVTTVVTDLGKFTRTELISNGILNPGVGSMLDQQTASYSNSTKPKAYLSWLLLDEQFKLVSSSSGFEQVGADGEFKTWVKSNLPINRNGYLYVYTSNESPVDVFFDNLQVSHIRGPLLEETHYYPFGLTMAGISSKAAEKLENRFKYNGGSELQHQEFSDGSGLEMYDTHFRQLDPQLGRWWQVDPKLNYDESVYTAMGNNPILNNDPLGDTTIRGGGFWRNAWEGLKDGGKSTFNFIKSLGTKEGWQNLANGINAMEGMDAQSVAARAQMGMQVVNGIKNIPNMTNDDWGHAVGFGTEKVAEGVLLSKGAGMFGESANIANPIPSQVSRVIPNAVDATMLGKAGAADVFVTGALDLKGLNASQIAKKLTIPESSSGYKVITFPTPQGIASPINRTTPGFIGGGRTAGGAREFVIPNQAIPANATIKIIKP
ncbi:MAG: Ig-like domain-containing protein [Bacteroidetes bacterium]|nr:Ig-like domain-containing protein [Bacteroidota bacterium]